MTTNQKLLPVRHSTLRLKNYNYSQRGGYYLTICAYKMRCIFGHVIDRKIHYSKIGKIALKYWLKIPIHYPTVSLDEFIVMPNHIHGILILENSPHVIRKPHLDRIIACYKASVTKTVRNLTLYPDTPLWQKNYFDHILRDVDDLERTQKYIIDNPARWEMEKPPRWNSPK